MAASWDWNKTAREFGNALLETSVPKVRKKGAAVLKDAQKAYLDKIQSNKGRLPYLTGNLHDSIATVVHVNGHLIGAYYMPREAKKVEPNPHSGRNRTLYVAQRTATRKRIYGAGEAYKAVKAVQPHPDSITATMVVGVPYAEYPNERGSHKKYLEWLSSTFAEDMEAALRTFFEANKGRKDL